MPYIYTNVLYFVLIYIYYKFIIYKKQRCTARRENVEQPI